MHLCTDSILYARTENTPLTLGCMPSTYMGLTPWKCLHHIATKEEENHEGQQGGSGTPTGPAV